MSYREPAVASLFYPGDPKQLTSDIKNYIKQSNIKPDKSVKGVIVPHAGYVYSGPIAGYGYGSIADNYEKVIIIGSSHRLYFSGISQFDGKGYKTPLGDIDLYKLPIDNIQYFPDAHRKEHTIEVQLPFLQTVLPKFKIFPIILGLVDPKKVAEMLIPHIDEKTLLVISTDLSHYLPYEQAQIVDEKTALSIEKFDLKGLNPNYLCGTAAVKTALYIAKNLGWSIERVCLKNSGDTAGDKKGVVGYGCWIFKK